MFDARSYTRTGTRPRIKSEGMFRSNISRFENELDRAPPRRHADAVGAIEDLGIAGAEAMGGQDFLR